MEFKFHRTDKGSVLGTEIDLRSMSSWRATPANVREVALAWLVTGNCWKDAAAPEYRFMPSQAEVETVSAMTREAVIAGRMIDFGYLPNEAIIAGGHRGGPLYTQGALAQPFADPWVFLHSWNSAGDDNRHACVYLVQPLEPDRLAGGDCEIVELETLQFDGHRILTIGDRVILTPDVTIEERLHDYCCLSCPSAWRFMPEIAEQMNRGGSPEAAAAGNVLDPLMTALLLLNTTGVERSTVRVSDKLNRSRARSNKPPIPPYDVVDSALYVTALTAHRSASRSEPLGGHHASPMPHIRKGHFREYASGRRTFIRDTLVRVTPEMRAQFKSQRSHYEYRV